MVNSEEKKGKKCARTRYRTRVLSHKVCTHRVPLLREPATHVEKYIYLNSIYTCTRHRGNSQDSNENQSFVSLSHVDIPNYVMSGIHINEYMKFQLHNYYNGIMLVLKFRTAQQSCN